VSHVEDIEKLREEIDRIDREIVEKIAEWVQASKELGRTDGEPFAVQIQGLAREHGIDVERVKRVFQAMAALVEDGRAG
jgi:chorismate mutase